MDAARGSASKHLHGSSGTAAAANGRAESECHKTQRSGEVLVLRKRVRGDSLSIETRPTMGARCFGRSNSPSLPGNKDSSLRIRNVLGREGWALVYLANGRTSARRRRHQDSRDAWLSPERRERSPASTELATLNQPGDRAPAT